MDLSTIFQFAPTLALHRNRTCAIHDVLTPDASDTDDFGDTAVAYAVAHHFLEATEHAARDADRSRFDWYRSHLDQPPPDWLHHGAHGSFIAISAQPATLVRSPIADTPYYLLGPDTGPPSRDTVELTAAALDIAARNGFSALVPRHAAITVLLVKREIAEPLNSWTITRLPGTVFVDHVNDPTILARDLIHEAGHNWFNDALNATRTHLDDKHTYYSPWKQTHRPAFGFLHSCWAFPLTMLFAASAIPDSPEASRRVLNSYLAQHRASLAQTKPQYSRALKQVTDQSLQHNLRTIHEAACQL